MWKARGYPLENFLGKFELILEGDRFGQITPKTDTTGVWVFLDCSPNRYLDGSHSGVSS